MWLWILAISLIAGLVYMARKIEKEPKEIYVPVKIRDNRYK